MNRTFLLVLGPTAGVAVGYIVVLRAMGLEPPYFRLAMVVVLLALVFWWIGRRSARNRENRPQA